MYFRVNLKIKKPALCCSSKNVFPCQLKLRNLIKKLITFKRWDGVTEEKF